MRLTLQKQEFALTNNERLILAVLTFMSELCLAGVSFYLYGLTLWIFVRFIFGAYLLSLEQLRGQ